MDKIAIRKIAEQLMSMCDDCGEDSTEGMPLHGVDGGDGGSDGVTDLNPEVKAEAAPASKKKKSLDVAAMSIARKLGKG